MGGRKSKRGLTDKQAGRQQGGRSKCPLADYRPSEGNGEALKSPPERREGSENMDQEKIFERLLRLANSKGLLSAFVRFRHQRGDYMGTA